jgi:hypothetical protein
MLGERRSEFERALRAEQGTADDSASMRDGAYHLWQIEHSKAAVRAIELGMYVTTAVGQEAPPLSMPGMDIAQVHGASGDKVVLVTILMSLQEFPELAQAREYHEAMVAFHHSELARKFNAMPDEQRLPLARRLDAILRNPEATESDKRFVADTIGWGTKLSAEIGLVFSR